MRGRVWTERKAALEGRKVARNLVFGDCHARGRISAARQLDRDVRIQDELPGQYSGGRIAADVQRLELKVLFVVDERVYAVPVERAVAIDLDTNPVDRAFAVIEPDGIRLESRTNFLRADHSAVLAEDPDCPRRD